MNYRLNKRALYGVLILVLLAAVIFGYTLVSAPTEVVVTNPEDTGAASPTPAQERSIQAQHQFVDGVHTLAGTIEVPTPCHRLLAEPFFLSEAKNQVEIRFTTAVEGDVCAQVLTPARFKVTFEAPEDATISATWGGNPAVLNLVPVPEGESLDNFELFQKG